MKSLFMRSRHDCEITHAREHFHSAGDNIVCRVLCVNVYFYVGRRENLTRHFAYCSTPFCERPKNNYEIAMQHDNKTPTWGGKAHSQVKISCPNIRHFDPVWYVPDHYSTYMYIHVHIHDWTLYMYMFEKFVYMFPNSSASNRSQNMPFCLHLG